MNLVCLFWYISLLVLVPPRTGTGARDDWCSGGDHEDGDGLPHPEDFLTEIFNLYGDNATCTIQHTEYEHLLEDLGIGSGIIHEPHVHKETYSVDHTCYDGHDLLTIHNVSEDVGLTEADFISMCPSFIQQVVQGCAEHTDTHLPPTAGEVWGYGIIAVTVVSACALIGLVLTRWRQSAGYKYILTVMLGLGVGTLVADSLMHLIPHGLGLHDHSHEGHDEGVDPVIWKTLLACLATLLFFNLQMILQYFQTGEGHSHGKISPVESNNTLPATDTESNGNVITMEKYTQKEDRSYGTDKDDHISPQVDVCVDIKEDIEKSPESLGWMIAIGDSFHNFADGLALAAAFSDSWQTGLGTTIAIFFHELPHEFGDTAAMLSVGWSWKRVLVFQCISQSPAYLGLFIGIPISENTSAKDWILIMTAGMFLYIALSNIVPELLEYYKTDRTWKIFTAANAGILTGYTLMLIIAILEETIHI